jgi:hypothetical protein
MDIQLLDNLDESNRRKDIEDFLDTFQEDESRVVSALDNLQSYVDNLPAPNSSTSSPPPMQSPTLISRY